MTLRVETLVADTARLVPDNVAVEDVAERWSYRQLMAAAERIVGLLVSYGAVAGDSVGIVDCGRAWTVAAMLATWRIGGIVVPLSCDTAPTQAASMAQYAGLTLILTSAADRTAVECVVAKTDPRPQVIDWERVAFGREHAVAPPRTHPSAPLHERCYIYWTSGSQGPAKGVIGLHGSLCAYVQWQARSFAVGPEERFSQVAPLTFDFSLKEIFVPLIAGARVCLLPRVWRRDPEALLDWLARSGVSTFCCLPTLFRALTGLLAETPSQQARLARLRRNLISGEQLHWEDVAAWRAAAGAHVALFNLYGPTESTVIKFCYPIPGDYAGRTGSVPVGRPIDGAELRLKDPDADGAGEVVILSDRIADGYCGGAAGPGGFTTEQVDGRTIRAYRTGDIGRLTENGDLVLIGRADRQLKIRGHRVELDAVEAVYRGHPAIAEVAVVYRRIGDRDELVCFYQSPPGAPDAAALRRFGREQLFAAAVPGRFVRLDALPLSANGKIDRSALALLTPECAPARRQNESAVEKLARLWCETLAIPSAELTDNFFELGGDSISAIRLLGRLRREFSNRVTLDDIFLHPTLASLALQLDDSAGTLNEVETR